MRGFVATTDWDWYSFLSVQAPLDEVNFWRPTGRSQFVALEPGEPFFFKLKAPRNGIGGFGWFARYSNLPLWLAWDSFHTANGAPDFAAFRARIERYKPDSGADPIGSALVGCRMISSPVFFPEDAWVRVPSDWSKNLVAGRGYDLDSGEGERLYRECLTRVETSAAGASRDPAPTGAEALLARESLARYGKPQLIKPRLGQGTFRVAVTDAYGRSCAVTMEHSLPVLDVAHIRPFSKEGLHEISNGLLLRTDIHRLFDRGYVTVTTDLRFEVSRRLKDEYENGRTYYAYQGKALTTPKNPLDRPSADALVWHNSNCFR
jgi:putative restriction endonuclease